MKLEIIDKYKPLFVDPPLNRYFLVTGSRGSGKSFAITLFLLNLTYQNGHVILFTRFTLVSAFISIIPEFISKIELLGKQDDFEITQSEIINKRTGSKILFRGIKTSSGDNTANLKSIAGVTTFVIEEAEELVDENIFTNIDLSVRSVINPNRVIIVMNPSYKSHWAFKRFVQNNTEDVTHIHTTYLDNLNNLSTSFIDQANKTKLQNPKKYNHTFLGHWLDYAEGLIFEFTIGEYQSQGIDVFGIDWGFSKDPTALIRISIDRKNRLLYLKEELYKTQLGLSDLEIILKEKCGKNLIYADSADPRLISDLRKSGLSIVGAKKGSGSILEGIKLMQDYTIIVDPSSKNLKNELESYIWKEKSLLPTDKWNHLIDAARMALTMSTKGLVSGYNVG